MREGLEEKLEKLIVKLNKALEEVKELKNNLKQI